MARARDLEAKPVRGRTERISNPERIAEPGTKAERHGELRSAIPGASRRLRLFRRLIRRRVLPQYAIPDQCKLAPDFRQPVLHPTNTSVEFVNALIEVIAAPPEAALALQDQSAQRDADGKNCDQFRAHARSLSALGRPVPRPDRPSFVFFRAIRGQSRRGRG